MLQHHSVQLHSAGLDSRRLFLSSKRWKPTRCIAKPWYSGLFGMHGDAMQTVEGTGMHLSFCLSATLVAAGSFWVAGRVLERGMLPDLACPCTALHCLAPLQDVSTQQRSQQDQQHDQGFIFAAAVGVHQLAPCHSLEWHCPTGIYEYPLYIHSRICTHRYA